MVSLFALTLFLSAFLLFLVQPMVAKMVLPILGGAPMVWNACVLFFQFVLLAGYGYAFAASRVANLRRHFIAHVFLLAVPFAVLPVLIDAGAVTPPEGNPIGWLLVLLATTIGLPFLVLSTSASVLQHWFSRTGHPAARDPYFLYVSSNAGSLLALASYPVVVEPLLPVGRQSLAWMAGYAMFAALTTACALASWRRVKVPQPRRDDNRERQDGVEAPISVGRRALWVAWSFVPSSLMLAVTSYLSTDIAAVPMLWILPLGVYLLTFILAFGRSADRACAVAGRAAPIAIVPLVLFMSTHLYVPLLVILPLHLVVFALVALLCHGQLAHDRPSAARLTEFYFWISCGGVLGGMFNTLAAPAIFRGIGEYPLILAVACLLLPESRRQIVSAQHPSLDWAIPAGIGGLTTAVLLWAGTNRPDAGSLSAAIAVPALASYGQRRRPRRFGLSVAAMLLAGSFFGPGGDPVLARSRTFFGVYRVSADRSDRYHALAHGTTLHGMQAVDPAKREEPLTYYHRTGPIGQVFDELPSAATAGEIGVVGLGVGTLAAYARPGQRWTFYEIDPEVERLARTAVYFTYLDACGDRCRVVVGDARLSLGRVAPNQYGVLVLDAFSSDAIPVHLLTREAVSLYLSRLAHGGVLAFHISNGHLSLAPVLAAVAASHHLVAAERLDRRSNHWPTGKSESHWVIMGRAEGDLGPLAADARWTRLVPGRSAPLWTDAFSNIFGVLNFR